MALFIYGSVPNGLEHWWAVITDHALQFEFTNSQSVTLFAQAMGTGQRNDVIEGMSRFFIMPEDWTEETLYEAMTVGVDSLWYEGVEILSQAAIVELGGLDLDAPAILRAAAEVLLGAI